MRRLSAEGLLPWAGDGATVACGTGCATSQTPLGLLASVSHTEVTVLSGLVLRRSAFLDAVADGCSHDATRRDRDGLACAAETGRVVR